MPTFAKITIAQAQAKSATGKRAALLQEYMGFIQELTPGEAGALAAAEGETTQAIRRRLVAAAEVLGTKLELRRADNTVYFWALDGRRRGRPRKNPVA